MLLWRGIQLLILHIVREGKRPPYPLPTSYPLQVTNLIIRNFGLSGPKPGPPRNVTVREEENGFIISWQHPAEKTHLVQYYTIRYRTDGPWKDLNKARIRPEDTFYLGERVFFIIYIVQWLKASILSLFIFSFFSSKEFFYRKKMDFLNEIKYRNILC